MNGLLKVTLLLAILLAGTSYSLALGQTITSNQSGNMNSSTLTPMGNLTNKSSSIMSNTT
jgi:hypothetical protein